MSFDFVTIGETMVRLNPPDHQRLERTTQLEINIGGTESNVAINLARLGKQAAWHSRLPDNPLGHQVAAYLRANRVSIESVTWTKDERQGVYFVEFGAEPRRIQVLYDRADSAASHMQPEHLPLDLIRDARWLHVTGITPALSPSCAKTITAAVDHAKMSGTTISFDVNFRAKLWEPAEAAQALEPLCQQADYTFLALRDAETLWGISGEAREVIQKLHKKWGGIIIMTQSEAGAVAFDGVELAHAEPIATDVVDRLGAGDALAAGIICRRLEDAPLSDALNFGTAMAALKLTIPGDVALVSREEVEAILNSTSSSPNR